MCGKLIRTRHVKASLASPPSDDENGASGLQCSNHTICVCVTYMVQCMLAHKKRELLKERVRKKNPLMIYLWRRVLCADNK